MRVNILLHTFCREPFGGLKQQYELANRLDADVVVYHSLNIGWQPRAVAGMVRLNLRGEIPWFDLKVRARFLPRINPRLLRKADVTIVSSANTANAIRRTDRTGRIVYVVYEYPVWRGEDDDLKRRLALALTRPDIDYIASSTATANMLHEFDSPPVAMITCAIDVPDPAQTRRDMVGFALRPEPYKGAAEMFKAITLVRQRHDITFECFGRYPGLEPVAGLRMLGTVTDAELLDFYRRCLVFVSPSYAEGWGLASVEAMANGAAVVLTDDGGSADFAAHGDTALVVPPRSPEAIADAVCALLENDALRRRVAAGGFARAQEMTWDRFVAEFERVLGTAPE
jgi:glycosyltransferase involved in cell wall biosynthesis